MASARGRYRPDYGKKSDDVEDGSVYVEELSWKIWLPLTLSFIALIVIIALTSVLVDSSVTKVSNQNLKDEIRKQCSPRFFNTDDEGSLEKLFKRYCGSHHNDSVYKESPTCKSQYKSYMNARFQHLYKYMETCDYESDSDSWDHYMQSSCSESYGDMRHYFDVRINYMYEFVKHVCREKNEWGVRDLKEYVGDKLETLDSKLSMIVVNRNQNNNDNDIDNDIDIIIKNENDVVVDINGHIDAVTDSLLSSLSTLDTSLVGLGYTLSSLEEYLGMEQSKRSQTNLRQFIADGFDRLAAADGGDSSDANNNNKNDYVTEEWSLAGYDLQNSNYNPHIQKINRRNVHSVKRLWQHHVSGTVGTATTSTTDGTLIFGTDFAGDVFALSKDGTTVWKRSVKSILGVDDADVVIVSRTAPALYNDCLGQECIILGAPGDRGAGGFPQFGGFFYDGPAKMFALNRHTGDTIWISPDLDSHPWSQIGSSPSVADGRVYSGIYSLEIVAPMIDENYPCCSFRGSAFALDASTGELLWQTYTIPEQPKDNKKNVKFAYAGAGIKGSSPSVDADSGLVFFGTGQFSMFPDRISACLQNQKENGKYPGESNFKCLQDNTYPDSILALNSATGDIVWSYRPSGVDGWNPTCSINPSDPNCPKPIGPDHDFSQTPIVYNVAGEKRLFALQKSGIAYSLRADNGAFRWSRYIPTGLLGGGSWGCAHDGQQNGFVCQVTGAPVSFLGNSQQLSYRLADGTLACDASWWFLDGESGEVKWQTLSPYARASSKCPDIIGNPFIRGMTLKGPDGAAPVPPSQTAVVGRSCNKRDSSSPSDIEHSDFARSYGGISVGNGIAYVTEMTGNMYALDTRNGDCLALMHCEQGSIYGAASLFQGDRELITVGCGYGRLRKEWVEHAGCEEGKCSVSAFGL